jgi:mannose-6-phosphate isomerase-like protein (cupin superfamily)
MPVFRAGPGQAPAWSELESFSIVRLTPGQTHGIERVGAREKLIVGRGSCRISLDGGDGEPVEEGANLDLTGLDEAFGVTEVSEAVTLIHMCGRWGDELGGSGLFSGAASADPQDKGDAVDYPKQTDFDSHYHDCDEHWILFEGRAEAISEGHRYEVGPGDCVATGMGHHHDLPIVHETLRAVYFETTMQGEKRSGHLWDHTHGRAQPIPERA